MLRTPVRTLLAAATALVVMSAPAGAVTNGQIDGARHPAVGVVLAELPGRGLQPLCSGTLVAPTVFLTAGHCTAPLPSLGVTRVSVSFDQRLERATISLRGGTFVTDPAYGHDRGDLHDLALVLLDEPVDGITPIPLASAGALDGLETSGVLATTLFTSVGYGAIERVTGGGQPWFVNDWQRRFAQSPSTALTPSGLRLRGNDTKSGYGGVCFGDSGGPTLLGDAVLVAVTSSGDQACAGSSVSYRVDTPAARAFLGGFLTLP